MKDTPRTAEYERTLAVLLREGTYDVSKKDNLVVDPESRQSFALLNQDGTITIQYNCHEEISRQQLCLRDYLKKHSISHQEENIQEAVESMRERQSLLQQVLEAMTGGNTDVVYVGK